MRPGYQDTPEHMREVLADHANAKSYAPVGVQNVMCGHCGERVPFWWHIALIPHRPWCALLKARRYFAEKDSEHDR